ncbi:MAG: HXXEE domain-containing protein [Calditrichaeota bacterium]|nr:MAG: HXXEE domain-containing protein [Calditrichota bacterium]
MLSLLPSIVVLGLAAFAALQLTLNRESSPGKKQERFAVARVLGITTVLQGIHFVEEFGTGFIGQLGAFFGLPAMPLSFFTVFNLLWLGIWIAAIPGLKSSQKWAFFAAWFLAIAGVINGIAHPLLAVAKGAYFPGLISAPFVGIASVWLWIRLQQATE